MQCSLRDFTFFRKPAEGKDYRFRRSIGREENRHRAIDDYEKLKAQRRRVFSPPKGRSQGRKFPLSWLSGRLLSPWLIDHQCSLRLASSSGENLVSFVANQAHWPTGPWEMRVPRAARSAIAAELPLRGVTVEIFFEQLVDLG